MFKDGFMMMQEYSFWIGWSLCQSFNGCLKTKLKKRGLCNNQCSKGRGFEQSGESETLKMAAN